MNSEEAEEIVAQYVKLTGRDARVSIYEHSLFDFLRAGFNSMDFVCVVTFLLRENKKNSYQYSLKLGQLINDHQRFMDLLGEARAKARNTVSKPTARDVVLHEWRGLKPESNGHCRPVAEVFEALRKATNHQ